MERHLVTTTFGQWPNWVWNFFESYMPIFTLMASFITRDKSHCMTKLLYLDESVTWPISQAQYYLCKSSGD